MTPYDCVIVGGGLVGASLACALRHTPLRLALIEAVPFDADQQPSYDDRGLALSAASRRILSGIGAWESIAPHATPIHAIHISERGRFGATRLRAQDFGMPALAHVVMARTLGRVLTQALKDDPHLDIHCPAVVTDVRVQGEALEVTARRGERTLQLSSRLLIVADGSQSRTRGILDVPVRGRDYHQTAIVANVTPSRPHQHVAYERFTPDGPVAVLPHAEGRCGLVYVVPTQESDVALTCTEAEFLVQVRKRFGRRLGDFTALGRRSHYPLRLSVAERIAGSRFVIIGNAAHAIHPNAAQGFNLGLRDVAVLAELLHAAARANEDVGSQVLTQAYAARCRTDQRRTIGFSDGLARLFYSDRLPLVLVRNAGMLAVDIVPPLKRALLRAGSGLRGPVPRLVQGLPL